MSKLTTWKNFKGLSVMDRYLTGELFLPLLFGLGLFTSLTLAIGTLFDLVRKITESGLPIGVAIKVLALQIPGFMVFAFPMAMLLATLMAYTRLQGDSEIVALRSIGVSVYRLILPTIAIGLIVTGITFVFNNFIAPAANYSAAIAVREALGKTQPSFYQSNILYPEFQKVNRDGRKLEVLSRLFYAEEFDGKYMRGVTVIDRSQPGISQIVTAQLASWNIQENQWDFYNGILYPISSDTSYNEVVRFEHFQLNLPQDALDVAQRSRHFDEMNLVQAQEYLKVAQLKGDQQRIRKVKVRIQEKISLPFVCLIYGLLGAAIGLSPQNNNRATSFGICVVLVFGYYLLSFLTSSLGIAGIIPPVLAAWLPNMIALGATSLLLVKTSA